MREDAFRKIKKVRGGGAILTRGGQLGEGWGSRSWSLNIKKATMTLAKCTPVTVWGIHLEKFKLRKLG